MTVKRTFNMRHAIFQKRVVFHVSCFSRNCLRIKSFTLLKEVEIHYAEEYSLKVYVAKRSTSNVSDCLISL